MKYSINIELNDEIFIVAAFLLGSYMKGTYSYWSDIDFALISDKFEGIRISDKDKIRRTTLRTDYRISPFPFRPEDFTEEGFFVKEIINTGIKIV